ncbi:MAG TPA: YncE family protein [Pyrinomonadaceae bacterium]
MRKAGNILTCLVVGIMFVFKSYVIVIGQVKPVLVALNKAEASMAIIDPATMTVTGKVPTGDGPHEVVLSPDGKTAYVANYGNQQPGNSISIIDIASAKELKRVDLAPMIRPHGIQLIGNKLYFTAEANRMIARLDTASGKLDWMMGSGQNGTHMVAGTADQKKFTTANIGSDSVTIFEFANGAGNPGQSKITHVAVGRQPEAVDISPDGKEVWTGLNADGMVEVVDAVGYKSVAKIDTKGRPYRVRFTPDGKTVVCTMLPSKDIVLIDAATRKETKRIKLESTPLGITFSADGKTAYVTVVEPDAVLKINLDSGEVTGRVVTGNGPDGIAVAGT